MSASRRRVELAPLYVLHHRPWRDTSRMLEVFTREHGRLTLFARGVRGPKSRTASLLQPFRRLLGSWSGSGDAGQLTAVEAAPMAQQDGALELPAAALLSAWYLNELLLKLTLRTDAQPMIFDLYDEALGLLRAGEPVPPVLRMFERRLLELLGYGIEFGSEARTGAALQPEAYYHFHPGLGFVETRAAATDGVFAGRTLLAIAAEHWQESGVLEDARKIMRLALDGALEGRELRTRDVARAVSRRTAPRRGEPS
ncbi:MAG: DNA repair protein RecO [Gammaproteobacteria bacterium]|nr:DNA repair protein RecO [Gammaproteobacteria bacterium]